MVKLAPNAPRSPCFPAILMVRKYRDRKLCARPNEAHEELRAPNQAMLQNTHTRAANCDVVATVVGRPKFWLRCIRQVATGQPHPLPGRAGWLKQPLQEAHPAKAAKPHTKKIEERPDDLGTCTLR